MDDDLAGVDLDRANLDTGSHNCRDGSFDLHGWRELRVAGHLGLPPMALSLKRLRESSCEVRMGKWRGAGLSVCT